MIFRETMLERLQIDRVPNDLVMRLHRATNSRALECRRVLLSIAAEAREDYVLAYEAREGAFHCWIDPLEFDPRFQEALRQAEAEASAQAEVTRQKWEQSISVDTMPKSLGRRGQAGFFCQYKKQILKERFNLSWRTPAEMNPFIIFD